MEITWRDGEGFWGGVHIATCAFDLARPKGEKAAYRATVHLPAGFRKEWKSKRFDTKEMGRAYCQRLATNWLKQSGITAPA